MDEVGTAVALGWQVAELFHAPVHEGAANYPPRGVHLPGRSEFPAATQSKWLGEQIQAQIAALFPKSLPGLDISKTMDSVLVNLIAPRRGHDATLDSVFELHCQIFEGLSVTDFRLGKAYGLGRALAETAFLPAEPAISDRADVFKTMLDKGRLSTLKDWLFDLKTVLPAHTAYAVTRALQDWETWAAEEHPALAWDNACHQLRVQGRIWRALVTGEKTATDILKLSDYMNAAQAIAARVWSSLRRYRLWLGLGGVAAVGVIVGISFLSDVPPSVRVIANLAWLAGVLGVSLKGAGALMGGALKDIGGWFWQSELDEAVAATAAALPEGATHKRSAPEAVGALLPAPL